MWDKKALLVALTFLVLAPISVYANDNDVDDGDSASDSSSSTASPGHWYVGGSTGYLKPDGSRLSGNTRTLGAQGGYQFNDRWSVDLGFQQDAFGPGQDNLKMHSLNFTRYWGNDIRFLVEFGSTHISLNGGSSDRATSGFHIGAGLSAFITDNWELRGDAKFINTMNGNLHDGMGTLSLNYHFVQAKPVHNEEESVLGASDTNESLPPMAYRESEEPAAPVVVEQPAPVVPAAPAVAVPKSIYTLVNFGFNSTDIGAQYGGQLDQISADIKATNSKVVIEGHTDSVGSNENNKILSMDRAIVVKRELKKRGVDGNDLQVVGFGEERPVATNDTEEGRKQNRRVEVKVYDK